MIRFYKISKEIEGRIYTGEIPAESLEEATRQADLIEAQVTGYSDTDLITCDICSQFAVAVDEDVLIVSGPTEIY